MTLIEVLNKVSDVLKQAIVGRVRVVENIETGVKIAQALRDADLGNDSNAVMDEVIVIARQVQQLAGAGSHDAPVQ